MACISAAKEILTTIDKAMNASLELRSKKELIERFINTLNANTDVDREWRAFANESRAKELEDIIEEENLKPEETRKFIANACRLYKAVTGLLMHQWPLRL